MYLFLGICLALAFLLAVNLLVAGLASAVWSVIAPRVTGLMPRSRSDIIFGLRMLPLASAVLSVVAFLIPAYIIYEPAASGEVVGGKLAVIAVMSAIGLAFAVFRVLRTWINTRRLADNWFSNAVAITVDGVDRPVFQIEHRFPVLAVIGVFRPRIFVARQVLASLEPAEFKAAIAHEYGHLTARDNLKRSLLRICRDLLIVPFGGGLDRAWSDSAEAVADEFAARTRGRAAALDLASALVKIGRLVPAGLSPAMPAGSFLVDEHSADITYRVRRLVILSQSKDLAIRNLFGTSLAVWLWVASITLLGLLPMADDRILRTIHSAIEHIVRTLQ